MRRIDIDPKVTMTVRIPDSVLAEIDALQARAGAGGIVPSRNALIAACIVRGLPIVREGLLHPSEPDAAPEA